MRICAVSDMHGHLPSIPPCELLILSGDIAPDFGDVFSPGNGYAQVEWFNTKFAQWLHNVQAEEVVATAGNHDFALFRLRNAIDHDLRWHLLLDDMVTLFDLKICGSPWITGLRGWSFNCTDEQMAHHLNKIPDDTDIVVLHGPAYGYGDELDGHGHLGSRAALDMIDRVQPRLVTSGHIHEAKGEWTRGRTQIVNVAYVNDSYVPTYAPWVRRFEKETFAFSS